MTRPLSLALALAAVLPVAACSGSGGSPAPSSPATPVATPSVPSTIAPATTPAPVTASPTPSPAVVTTASASPAPTATPAPTAAPAGLSVTGTAVPQYANLDNEMEAFMVQNGIRAGQLAVGSGGTVTFSRAYTYTTDPSFPITQPSSIMRVSSNSKAIVTAAITALYANGTLSASTPVYSYLGIAAPLLASQTPDPNANAITVQELVDHTAGFHNDDGTAPEFNMYSIERQASLSGPLTKLQFAQYLYGQPLQFAPGTQTLYSNEDYFLLARVIEKATGENYIDYVNQNVLGPIGVTDAVVTATAQSGRLANEVICDDPSTGYSVLTPQAPTAVPGCYGGITVYEDLDGPSSISISASSLVKILGNFNAYGLGKRRPGYAREGSFVGSLSWMEALSDGKDFAFSFNARVDLHGNAVDVTPLTKYFETNI